MLYLYQLHGQRHRLHLDFIMQLLLEVFKKMISIEVGDLGATLSYLPMVRYIALSRCQIHRGTNTKIQSC